MLRLLRFARYRHHRNRSAINDVSLTDVGKLVEDICYVSAAFDARPWYDRLQQLQRPLQFAALFIVPPLCTSSSGETWKLPQVC